MHRRVWVVAPPGAIPGLEVPLGHHLALGQKAGKDGVLDGALDGIGEVVEQSTDHEGLPDGVSERENYPLPRRVATRFGCRSPIA